MTLRAKLFLLIFLTKISGCSPSLLKLSAPPGRYQLFDLAKSSETATIALKMSMTEFENDAQWPSAAYVGFYQGENQDKSIQFMIVRYKETDNYMDARYRVFEDGKQIKIVSLEKIELNKPVDISMTFAKGIVTISLNHGKPI